MSQHAHTTAAPRHRRDWFRLRPWQRHSLVLAVAGSIYLALGMVWVQIPLTPDRAAGLHLALLIAPIQAWGVLWCLVGSLALASTRWPPASKTWGYTALTALAALWGSFYGLGTLLLGAPVTGLTGALIYYLLAFAWWAISGLINPDDIPKVG